MDTVSTNDREIAYVHDEGSSGRTTLYVHGSGGSHGLWDAQRRLADRPTAALDLSGHGDSEDVDAAPGYTTLSAYADDTLAVAKATDADVLVGSSLGGAVCMHLLIERSDWTPEAVVLTGVGARMGVLSDLLEWLEDDFERALEFLHGPDRLFADPDERAVERSKAEMRACGQRVVRRDFLTCHEFDVRERLGAVGVPALALYGERDLLTPPWYHEYLAEGIPEGALAGIEDAAHLAMIERPRAFSERVDAFLAELPSS